MNKKLKKHTPWTRNQILCLVLIVSIVFNALIHFTHPAYKFYRSNISRIDSDLAAFKDKVSLQFVPAIMSAATNKNVTVVQSKSVATSLPDLQKSVKENAFISARFFRSGNSPGIVFEDHVFMVGDYFLGSPILYIDPTLVRTADHQYFLRFIVKGGSDVNS